MIEEELSAEQQGVISKHPYTFGQVRDFVADKQYCSTKRLRIIFGISGTLAAIFLRGCGFVHYSRIHNAANYKRMEECVLMGKFTKGNYWKYHTGMDIWARSIEEFKEKFERMKKIANEMEYWEDERE